jgi:hypothetical protein
MPTPKHFSLRLSLGSAFASIVILTALCLGFAIFFNVRTYVRRDLMMRIHDLAGTTAAAIDGRTHNAIKTQADEASENYITIKKLLQG